MTKAVRVRKKKKISLRLSEINKANDVELKSSIADMIYLLKITSDDRKLTVLELHAYNVLKDAATKKARFFAIKRVSHIIKEIKY
jgi:DNA integrity scanning protein DisA with diadenylate cyclase activity